MTRRSKHVLIRLAAVGLWLVLATGPAWAGLPPGASDVEDGEARTLADLLDRYGWPQVGTAKPRACLGYLVEGEDDAEPFIAWYVFPGPAGDPGGEAGMAQGLLLRLGQGFDAKRAARIAADCGSRAALFSDLARLSCGAQGDATALLANLDSLNSSFNDLPTTLRPANEPVPERSYFAAGTSVACASTVSSSDGKVRAWVIRYERQRDAGAFDNGEEPRPRGLAYLQRVRDDGAIDVWRDASTVDLHLDTVVDALVKTPGPPDEYLITGVRTYLTTFPGDLPRRYAQVVRLGTGIIDVQPVKNAFLVQGKPRPALLLRAPAPFTGKFRHHDLAHHWLRLQPASGLLELVPIDPAAPTQRGQPTINAVVARYAKGSFVVKERRWGPVRLADSW